MCAVTSSSRDQLTASSCSPRSTRRQHGPRAPKWIAAPLSVLVVACLYGLLFIRNHRYYFIDDRITDSVPKLMDIGRTLRAGQLPWLTTDVVNSGAHAVEYQNGVFNPLILALSVPLSMSQDIALGAFLFVLVHALLLTAAAAWLGGLVGLARAWQVTFAVSLGFQPYTVFWGASAWFQAVASLAWFTLAVAASFAFHQSGRRRYGWAIVLSTYGCLTSGWPLAIPMLGLVAIALIAVRQHSRLPWRRTAWYAAYFGCGVTSATIALFPLLVSFQFASRSSSISNADNFNVVPLDGLAQFANPGYYGFFHNFGGYQLQELPHFYVAWFILPVLLFWKPEPLRPDVAVLAKVSLVMLVASAVLALGPERLLVFRFPTRFLQYFALFLLLLSAIIVANGRFVSSRRRVLSLLGALLFLAASSLQAHPQGALRVLAYTVVSAGMCVLFHIFLGSQGADAEKGPAFLSRALRNTLVPLLGTILILTMLAVDHPSGRGIDWGFPHDLASVEPLSLDDYTLFYGNYLPPEGISAAGFSEYHPSGMGLMVGDRKINGYSPLGHRFFRQHFPIDDQGNFQPGGASKFTAVDPETGLQYLELLRVDQVISILGPMDEELSALGNRWAAVKTGQFTRTYRHADYRLPGLVSYVSPGLSVTPSKDDDCSRGHLRECLSVTAAPEADGQVIFARLWFPGYRATLDGAPLKIERHADMLVSVSLPAGVSGELVLKYRPPGLYEFGGLALLALILLGAASIRSGPAHVGAVARRNSKG